ERDPHRLRLVERHHHAAALAPVARHARGEVLDMPQRKGVKPGRQRVMLAIVRNAQGSLEANRRLGVLVNLRKTENQAVAFVCNHLLALCWTLQAFKRHHLPSRTSLTTLRMA